jgi:YgiT-type zinc finger domain-containing protein
MELAMICDACGKKGARSERITRFFGRGRATFLIENVPVVTCPSCGERYMTAETLKEIEGIRMHWRQLSADKRFRVARFEDAARADV